MELNTSGLRKRRGSPGPGNGKGVSPIGSTSTKKENGHSNKELTVSKDETVWGKTDDGTIFKVPTTHDVLTLFNPTYPKSHFDILSLFLLGSQIVIFFTFLYLHQQNPTSNQQGRSKAFFLTYFIFWRAMYDGGLGWVLTRQSKRRWIVRWVRGKGWFDSRRNPKMRDWLRRQLKEKMGKDYAFDDLPLEYNTWLLFRQVVDIILLNDFVSYIAFSLSTLDILFPNPAQPTQSTNYSMLLLRLSGGLALLLFNLWVKTSAHDVVKDYGWYWGDCFFSRGYLRKADPNPIHADLFDQVNQSPLANKGRASLDSVDSAASSVPKEDKEEKELQFDLVFDGIFEMAPHPMYSVGYAGYYGVSLLAFSYQVLFVSLAAHAAQFAFLNFFENPHIERRYGVRKVLAERTPIVLGSRAGTPLKNGTPVRTGTPNGVQSRSSATIHNPSHMNNVRTVDGEPEMERSKGSPVLPRSRSVSWGTHSATETTAIDSEELEHDARNQLDHDGLLDHDALLSSEDRAALRVASEGVLASITPPNGARDVVQEAVTQHDLLSKFFRRDVIVLSKLDLLRASDQLLLLVTFYIIVLSVLPLLNVSRQTITLLHFTHALLWRTYYSFILGLLLKAQSQSKYFVRHFLEHYHYAPLSLVESPRGGTDRAVKEGAIREAFDNWKGMYNLGMVMCYVSFIGFAAQTYHLPTAWTVGDELLRHTLGALLVALHMWAASESYEVLGIFGWFFGDFFIDDYPASLNYTGIYRFLNNPERTMSGAALFGIALITGNKIVFTLAILGHLAHWWFLSWVEGPHMRKLYGDSLRKDAGFTKMLKKLAKRNAKMFEGVRAQLNLLLDENSAASKQAPELHRVAKGVKEVGEKIGEVYVAGGERVEDVWKRSGPKISEVLAETRTLIQQSRERFVIPLLARDLADYDQSKYMMYVVPTNPDGQLRFHWGEPITVVWRGPLGHSRRDWVGIYRYGANKSLIMTKTSTLGLWVPVHDEEWDGDVPRPLTDRNEGEETECGEISFKNSTLPWQAGDYELRYHHDGKYNVVALVGPIQIYLDRPDGLDFKSIRKWLLKIVNLALDSDPSLIPNSSHATISPEVSTTHSLTASSASIATTTPNTGSSGSNGASAVHIGSYDPHEDDFRFWSERQAKRISYAISQVLRIEFAPEVIVADANVTALTRRILASKELLD